MTVRGFVQHKKQTSPALSSVLRVSGRRLTSKPTFGYLNSSGPGPALARGFGPSSKEEKATAINEYDPRCESGSRLVIPEIGPDTQSQVGRYSDSECTPKSSETNIRRIEKAGWRQGSPQQGLELGGLVDCKVSKSGEPTFRVFDTSCAKPCIVKHEKKHYEDMKPCCTKFNHAYKNAMKKSIPSIEESIYVERLYQLAFDIWKHHHRPWKEIRAFNEILLGRDNGNCFDTLREQNECSEKPESQCCREINEQENNSLKQQKYYMEMFAKVRPVECDVKALLSQAEQLVPRPRKPRSESLFNREDILRHMDEYMRRKILESVQDIPSHETEVLPEPEG